MYVQNTCKLTGTAGQYVDCHVVPKTFFGKRRKVKSLPSLSSHRPKRAPIGLYDPELVIHETELRFAEWDDYGIKFLRHGVGRWTALETGTAKCGLVVTAIDYRRLRLFFLSILWRATASTRVSPKADLRGQDDELRQLVSDGDPGSPDQFAVRLTYYPDALRGVVMPPMGKMIDGKVCAFGFFGCHDVVWSVEAPAEPIMSELYLRPREPWLVLSRPWSGSVSKSMVLTCIATHPTAFGANPARP